MEKQSWVLCPVCSNKTRTRIRKDTELINFPLYCPKCKVETLINIKYGKVTVIKEPVVCAVRGGCCAVRSCGLLYAAQKAERHHGSYKL